LTPPPGPEDHDVLTPPDAPPISGETEIPTQATPKMFAGHYRVERELGRGGMATVYLCTDLANIFTSD